MALQPSDDRGPGCIGCRAGAPTDDDLFRSAKPAAAAADSAPPETQQVAPPRLVQVVPEAKILYSDRTCKIVYDCKLFSDNSRVYHGNYVEFYRNGKEFCRGTYRDGRRHGKWAFLLPDGAVAKEGEYADDKPIGTWTVRRADGSLLREETYNDDGRPHGTWVSYGPDGKSAVSRLDFVNGKLKTS